MTENGKSLVPAKDHVVNPYEHLPLGYQSLDENGVVLHVNSAWLELMGIPSATHVVGRDFKAFLLPDERDSFGASFASFKKDGVMREKEFRLLHSDERIITVVLNGRIQYDQENCMICSHSILRDCTRMKEQDQAKHEQDTLLRAVIELVPHSIFAKDAHGTFLMVNKAAARLIGASQSQLTGSRQQDYFSGPDAEIKQFLQDDLEVIQHGLVKYIHDEEMTAPDGRKHYLETIKIPFDFAGVPAALGVATDVTRQKNVEQRLVLEMEVLALLNHGIGSKVEMTKILERIRSFSAVDAVGLRVLDGDDYPYYCSVGFCDEFLKKENFLFRHDENGKRLLDEDGNPVLECMCGLVLRGGTNEGLDGSTPGGSFFVNSTTEFVAEKLQVVEDAGVALRNQCNREGYESVALIPLQSQGIIIGLLQLNSYQRNFFDEEKIAFYEGLSESIGIAIAREHIRQALQQSQQRLSYVMDATDDGMLDYDITTGQCYFSPHYYTMLGYEPNEFESSIQKWRSLLHPSDRKPVLAAFYRHVDNEAESVEVEFRLRMKSGNWKWILGRAKLVERDANGKPLRLVGTHIDISDRMRIAKERRQLENQLRLSQKNDALGTLAGGIAHDFNNILYAVQGYAELARAEIHDESPIQNNIEQILLATNRAHDLVRQILSFSSRVDEVPEPTKLQKVVQEVATLLRAAIPKSIDIIIEAEPDTHMVLVDSTQMHQVIMNLCTNSHHAIRAENSVGTIKLTLHNVIYTETMLDGLPSGMAVGPYVRFAVSDTGSGIDQSISDRVFDPYFTTKDKSEGTGLGLAVVRNIVEANKGCIHIESGEGEGTSIIMHFPRCMPTPDETTKHETSVKKGQTLSLNNASILFVDDEETVCDIGKVALQRFGFQVHAYVCGVEALKVFEDSPERFDMIVTDLSMPQITGLELAKKARQIRHGIPVILCSGYTEKTTIDMAHDLGINHVLQKPIRFKALRQVIDSCLMNDICEPVQDAPA